MKNRVKQLQKSRRILAILLSTAMTGSLATPLSHAVEPKTSDNNGYTQEAISKKEEALAKLSLLKSLMAQAETQNLDVYREEIVAWMATEFIKFSDYDEANADFITDIFNTYAGWTVYDHIDNNTAYATMMGQNLYEFEREEVVELLDEAIIHLQKVISGEIVRTDTRKVDWHDIGVDMETGNFINNSDGQPIFVYDYFSKAQQGVRSDPFLYNDYIGNVNPVTAWSLSRLNEYTSASVLGDVAPLDVTAIAEEIQNHGTTTKLVSELARMEKELGEDFFNSMFYQQSIGINDYYPREGDPLEYTDYFGNSVPVNDNTGAVGNIMLWHSGTVYHDWLIDKDGDLSNSIYSEDFAKTNNNKYVEYDIDLPGLREIWDFYLRNAVPIAKETSGIDTLGYILSNEPHWDGDNGQSQYTLAKFQSYLEEKYGDMETLKATWGKDLEGNALTEVWGGDGSHGDTGKMVELSALDSFQNIAFGLPVSANIIGTPQYYDFCDFNMERVTDWYVFLSEAIVSYDAEAGTHIKLYPRINTDTDTAREHGIDLEALSRVTTYLGNDVTIRENTTFVADNYDWDGYSYYWREAALTYDLTNSFSPTIKPNVNSEGHAITINTVRDMDMESDYVFSSYWLSSILGEDANFTWFWPRNGDGSPEASMSPGADRLSRYPGSVVTMPEVANEITQVFTELNAHASDITKFQIQDRPLRVFYSETSNINNTGEGGQMDRLFEMYEAVYFDGISVGFASEQILSDVVAKDGSYEQDFDVVVIYDTAYVTDSEFDAIVAYGKAGGKVILDSKSLLYNEHGVARDSAELTALKALSSVTVKESIEDLKTSALAVVQQAGNLPTVQVSAPDMKGVIWRVVDADTKGNQLLTVMNVKNSPVTVDITGFSGKILDRMTGQEISGTALTLDVNEVLFVELGNVSGSAVVANDSPYQPALGVTVDGGRAVLVWEDVSGADSYNVYQDDVLLATSITANDTVFSPDQFANETKAEVDKTSEFNHIVLMLEEGDYQFTVKALVDGKELTGAAESISVESTGVQNPVNPSKVTAVGSTTENYVVDLSWEGGTAQSYAVYEKVSGNFVLVADGLKNENLRMSTVSHNVPHEYYVVSSYHGVEAKPEEGKGVTVTISGKPALETPKSGVNVLTDIQTSYFGFEDTTGTLGGDNYGQWYSTSTTGENFSLSVQPPENLPAGMESDGQVLRVLPRAGMIGMQTVGPTNANRPANTTFTADMYEEGAEYYVTMDVYVSSESDGFLNDLTITAEASGGMAGASATAPKATVELALVTERDQWVTVSSTQFTKPQNIFKTSTFVKLFYPATTSNEAFYIDNIQFKKITETPSTEETHWYDPAVEFVLAEGLLQGMEDGEFYPLNTMSHSMMWAVLYRYSGDNVVSEGTMWYSEAQKWAMDKGLTEGANPDQDLTREELAQLFYLLDGSAPKGSPALDFADSDQISDKALDAMNWAVEQGLLMGDGASLNPQKITNRAEISQVLMNYLG